VNPSIATVSPSFTFSEMASASEVNRAKAFFLLKWDLGRRK